MDIKNMFIYKILNQYADLNNIFEKCKNNGTFKIDNNIITGRYIEKEILKSIIFEINDDFLELCITYDNTKIEIISYKTNNEYVCKYMKFFILQNDKKVNSKEIIFKKIRYDINKSFINLLEVKQFFSKIKSLSRIDYKIEKARYDKISENSIVKKHEINCNFNNLLNKKKYLITNNFKSGIFLSDDIDLGESYMSFFEINENTYNNYIENIKKSKKDIKIHKNML